MKTTNKTTNKKALTKKDLITLFQENIKTYAIPKGLNKRSREEVLSLYCEAVELGLIKYCECAVYMSNGDNGCLFCGKPMKPIKKRLRNEK